MEALRLASRLNAGCVTVVSRRPRALLPRPPGESPLRYTTATIYRCYRHAPGFRLIRTALGRGCVVPDGGAAARQSTVTPIKAACPYRGLALGACLVRARLEARGTSPEAGATQQTQPAVTSQPAAARLAIPGAIFG